MMRLSQSFARPAMLLLLWGVGCADSDAPPPTTPVAPRETPWEAQLVALRDEGADSLRLSGTPVTADQWAMLAEGCTSLEVLEADVTALTPDQFSVLAELPLLRQLVLHGPIDDVGLEAIATISSLRNLNLPDGEFTNSGLAQLAELPHLELLRFRSPQVNDDGLAVIADLPALRFLHLINVPVTDEGLKRLYGMQQLESFYLDGGRCTDEGLHALLQALPELHFHRDQLHLPDDPHAHPHE